MLADLTMMATLPVTDSAGNDAQHEADKAAAGETMPPPKEADDESSESSDAGRIARRGQDLPEPAQPGDEKQS